MTDKRQPDLAAIDARRRGVGMRAGGPFRPGLPPPVPHVVNFFPTTGAVGTTVLLQGAHFVGTTAVSVNGVNATFKLLTANYISLTIPSGATTGKITVANAGGKTTSAKSFTVQ